jgi:hypothetical protein
MRNSKRISVIAGGTAALIGVGVAFAAWTSTGTDSATVAAGSESDLVVVVDTVVDNLYPTTSVSVPVSVTIVNPYKVQLTEVSYDGATADSAHANAGCDAAVVEGSDDDAPALEKLDAAGGSAVSATHHFTITMTNAADPACQGATFTLAFSASGDSSE